MPAARILTPDAPRGCGGSHGRQRRNEVRRRAKGVAAGRCRAGRTHHVGQRRPDAGRCTGHPPRRSAGAGVADAEQAWNDARNAIAKYLAKALLGVLTDIPGASDLIGDVGKLKREGVHGALDVGPVHLEVSSATLVLQPPELANGVIPEPIVVGPFRVGAVSATLVSPFGAGKGVPGGGSIVELPNAAGGDRGYGGLLQLPLGPVKVSASAILCRSTRPRRFWPSWASPSLPPVQLVVRLLAGPGRRHRRRQPPRRGGGDAGGVRTGSAGNVLFSTTPPADRRTCSARPTPCFPRRPAAI